MGFCDAYIYRAAYIVLRYQILDKSACGGNLLIQILHPEFRPIVVVVVRFCRDFLLHARW